MKRVCIEPNQIHVWRASLAVDAARERALLSSLSEDERERADRRQHARARRELIVSRGVLRELLAASLDCSPESLAFGYGDKDKPYLLGPRRLSFNVSHSGDVLVNAIALDGELGIDVERIRCISDLDAIARRFFSHHEQRALAALPTSDRPLGFYRCWTRKEAFIKARGMGLSLPLAQFDVTIDAQASLIATRPNADDAQRYRLHDLQAPAGYVAALACSHKTPRILEHEIAC